MAAIGSSLRALPAGWLGATAGGVSTGLRGRLVGFLGEAGVGGATVLEVGGGVGGIRIELLRRGAERSVNLELSPAYEREAEGRPAAAT